MKCKRGYHRFQRGCKRCEEGCGECDDNGRCIVCAHGFVLDPEYGKCVENYEDENCAVRNPHGVCAKCKEGYGFNKFYKCVACDPACKQCHYADRCLACKYTFYNFDGQCIPCSKRGCDLCDAKECFSCQPHSYLHNGVCVRGPPGCSLCHDKAPICRVCEKGMKMKDGHCIPDCDIKNCAKCNGDETCRYCKSTLTPYGGYEPAPNGTEPCPFVCDPVELNCLLTEKMKKGETEACFALGCKFCPPHTFRKDHKCEKCAEGCDRCLNENECIKCLPGYSYFEGKCYKCNKNGVCGEGEYMDGCECKECKKKYPHCAACNNEQCIVCEPRFVLAENKTSCVPCRGKNCKRPTPEPKPKDDDCPDPCIDEPCPPPPPTPTPEKNETCDKPEHITVSNGEEHFDPACKERDPQCYCVKCYCGYELDKYNNHTCVKIKEEDLEPHDCPPTQKWDGCECKDPCLCGEKEDGTCNPEPKAIEGCLEVTCQQTCKRCMCGFFKNGTICSKCEVNSTIAECNRPDCPCEGPNCPCKEENGCCPDGFFYNTTTLKCGPCSCPKCIEFENSTKCVVCLDGTIPLDGNCNRIVSLSRSSTTGVSVLVAVVMVIVMLI